MNRLFRDIIILLSVFALIWGIFALYPLINPDTTIFDIPVSTEEDIGRTLAEDFFLDSPEYQRIESPLIDSAINVIKERLLSAMDSTDYNYKIYVVDNPQINAFALPGGYIIVLRGLLEFTETPEELSAIIAHEMGHIEKKHVVKKLIRQFGIVILTSGDQQILQALSSTIISTGFDRSMERQADDFALGLMEKAGINPRVMGLVFTRFSNSKLSYNENLEIIMTHPHNSSRIRKSFEYETGPDFEEIAYDIDWEEVKAAITVTTETDSSDVISE